MTRVFVERSLLDRAEQNASMLDGTMKFIEAELDHARFVRVHHSHSVNIERIRELQPFAHGDCVVVVEEGTRARLSRGRRAELDLVLGWLS